MKLNRREFLKALGAVGAGAGAVLAGVGVAEAGGTAQVEELSVATSVTSSGTCSSSSSTLSHELLSEVHSDIDGTYEFLLDDTEYFTRLYRATGIAMRQNLEALLHLADGADA